MATRYCALSLSLCINPTVNQRGSLQLASSMSLHCCSSGHAQVSRTLHLIETSAGRGGNTLQVELLGRALLQPGVDERIVVVRDDEPTSLLAYALSSK